MAIETREPSEPEAPRSVLDGDGHVVTAAPDIPAEGLAALHRTMVVARRLDEKLALLQRQGTLPFHLPAHGHEAVGAAIAHALSPQDWLFGGFRDLAALVGRGVPLERIAHQAFGSRQAPSKGRVLPAYQIHREFNIASASAIGAAHLVHATGVAWAAKLRSETTVALASFAGGAAASGEFHAALNFAGVFGVPAVFVCTNLASEPVAPHAGGYGLRGIRVDAADVLAMVEALASAVAQARGGQGATLVEAVMSRGANQDPVERFERYLRDRSSAAIDVQALDREIEAAIEQASQAPGPDVSTLFSDVWSTPVSPSGEP